MRRAPEQPRAIAIGTVDADQMDAAILAQLILDARIPQDREQTFAYRLEIPLGAFVHYDKIDGHAAMPPELMRGKQEPQQARPLRVSSA